MKYRGNSDFQHDQRDRIGIIITNLGTPEAPTPGALRRYLGEFLADPRVVEVPRPLWRLILHGVILRIRPRRSAHAYQQVWTERGSPLMYHTADQAEGLREHLQAQYGDRILVDFAMRYGQPGIANTIDRMLAQGVRKLLILPLYPQYSAATTGSTFDALAADFRRRRWLPELRFVSHYHDYPAYIDAMATHIRDHWQLHGRSEKLVLSYHGIPKRYLLAGDPYFCECHKTSRLLAKALGLGEDDYVTSFQSRFGRAEWLKPYTDATLKQLPEEGVRRVDVFCPGFAADCLETLEEIAVENRGYFMEAGGEEFHYIPALNAGHHHLEALASLVGDNLGGWLGPERDGALSAHLADSLKDQDSGTNK